MTEPNWTTVRPQSFPIKQEVSLADGSRLILFDSERPEGGEFKEITGRELFLFDKGGLPHWCVRLEPGKTNNDTMQFDTSLETDLPLVYLMARNTDFFVQRYNGDTFIVDVSSGVGRFHHWSKS